MATVPIPTGDKALCVAYYASAEMDCFHAMGWSHPVHVLDLFTEFRCLTNGLRLAHGSRLLGALLRYGLPSIAGKQKDAMRDLVLTGGPWSEADQLAILDYCETDVVALAHLLTTLQDQIDWPRVRPTPAKATLHNACCLHPIGREAVTGTKRSFSAATGGLLKGNAALCKSEAGGRSGRAPQLQRTRRPGRAAGEG